MESQVGVCEKTESQVGMNEKTESQVRVCEKTDLMQELMKIIAQALGYCCRDSECYY